MSASFTCHFLDASAFKAAEDARMALAKRRGEDQAWLAANKVDYGWARIDEVTAPCAMWFAPWYFDPADPADAGKRARALAKIAVGTFDRTSCYLSKHYWQDWSAKRPPICVLCPNGAEWVVDALSSNGDGWKVTGDPPRITCSPSIMVPGYHGFLRDGVFTPSI